MNLTVFSTDTFPLEEGGGIRTDAWILFGKSGKITLSAEAATLMGISAGDKLSLAQNDDQPEVWYAFKDLDGFELQEMKSGKLFITHPELASSVTGCLGLADDQNHRAFLTEEPVKFRRKTYWLLRFDGQEAIVEVSPE